MTAAWRLRGGYVAVIHAAMLQVGVMLVLEDVSETQKRLEIQRELTLAEKRLETMEKGASRARQCVPRVCHVRASACHVRASACHVRVTDAKRTRNVRVTCVTPAERREESAHAGRART